MPGTSNGASANGNGRPALLRSDLMRLATAGSVDDGKSTLIGRLLYDTKAIFQDQLDAVAAASIRRHGDEGAVESRAATLEEVVTEIAATRITERGETRADDRASEAAMEDRKREGYF